MRLSEILSEFSKIIEKTKNGLEQTQTLERNFKNLICPHEEIRISLNNERLNIREYLPSFPYYDESCWEKNNMIMKAEKVLRRSMKKIEWEALMCDVKR